MTVTLTFAFSHDASENQPGVKYLGWGNACASSFQDEGEGRDGGEGYGRGLKPS